MPAASEEYQVAAQQVKELRERTGAGFNDCRGALMETKGEMEQAINVLRKKGQAAAQKKAQRATTEGLVSHYIHAGGKIGVLIEVNCESDFVARTDDFQKLCHDVAMHIAALDPRFLRREEVTQETLDREREIYKARWKFFERRPAPPVSQTPWWKRSSLGRWKNSTKKIVCMNSASFAMKVQR